MKTKDLIKLLQKADPSGEKQCCIDTSDGNVDIFDIYEIEGYYDGPFEILKRDESNPYYNVIGAEYRNDGSKIVIKPLSIHDALLEDPELPVKVVDTFCQKKMDKEVESWRGEIRKIKKEDENKKWVNNGNKNT